MYIKAVLWNGKPYLKNYISYADIMNGGKLEIYLQSAPAPWGSLKSSRAKGLSEN
jgi:putative alpha-1,2-mannosidase